MDVKAGAPIFLNKAMAIDFNSVKLLLWAKNLGVDFTRTATLGHQGLSCSIPRFRGALKDFNIAAREPEIASCFQHEPCAPLYSDEFLRLLGAKEITIVDNSDFEGANCLHDLNQPFPENMRGSFDLILDGGTLEHIFNFQAALKNCLELLRAGGHFIAIPPANGQIGHGFYQFSPELFFGIFNNNNGFALRKIVLFDPTKVDAPFYEVKNPAEAGVRLEMVSSPTLQLGILAQRIAEVPILAIPPQQSDYVTAWKAQKPQLDRSNILGKLRFALNPYWPYWMRNRKRLLVHWWKFGSMNLSNKRYFRRLRRKEIAKERVAANQNP